MRTLRTALLAYVIICPALWGVGMLVHLLITPAEGHSWYPPQCCKGRDCHPVECETITRMPNAYRYKNMLFSPYQHHWSEDGGCHVCVSFGETQTEIPRCIFTPVPVQS